MWFNKKINNTPEEIDFKPYEEKIIETPLQIPSVPQEPAVAVAPERPASPVHNTGDGVEIKLIRPESYSEVSFIADNLLAGCTVVLNVEVLDRATTTKMLDFLNGVTYCTDGEIKVASASTFIITPHSKVDISDM